MGTRNGKAFLSDECEDQRTQEMTGVDNSEVTSSGQPCIPQLEAKARLVGRWDCDL